MLPDIFSSINTLFLLKIALAIILFLYSIFAFVIFNQSRAMRRIVNQSIIGMALEVLAFLHFAAAVSLFIYTIAIL